MSSDVKRHVHRCSTCSRSAVGRRKASGQAKCQIYTQPAAVVGFDIVGPLKTNVRGEEKYVLSIQCYMTRFVVFVAIPNRKADTVVRALGQHWIHRFGARLAKRSGSPSVATVTEKQKQGVLLLIRATQALYDTAGAHGYQRREGKIATFPF